MTNSPHSKVKQEPPDNMGVSVTPHVGITTEWKLLACGIDSLDLSVYVFWEEKWLSFMDRLAKGKEAAFGHDKGVPWEDTDIGPCLIWAGGKKPYYTYHLELREFHIWIGLGQCSKFYANVYVSINSRTLWSMGVDNAWKLVQSVLFEWGGSIRDVKVSRCDLCCDYFIPGGISLEFIRQLGVPNNRKTYPVLDNDILETCYVGSKNGAIVLRIYDKTKEIKVHDKMWFLDVWKIASGECCDVWRVEYQLRRTAIKEYGVNSIGDFYEKVGGMWADLAGKWWSVRLEVLY